jgi:1-acyl-sn-glycerol-3-phosphate acyltransferase
MTFADNKKRLSYTFLSGSPGLLRAMVHTSIETQGLTLESKKEIKDKARFIILNQLKKYNP